MWCLVRSLKVVDCNGLFTDVATVAVVPRVACYPASCLLLRSSPILVCSFCAALLLSLLHRLAEGAEVTNDSSFQVFCQVLSKTFQLSTHGSAVLVFVHVALFCKWLFSGCWLVGHRVTDWLRSTVHRSVAVYGLFSFKMSLDALQRLVGCSSGCPVSNLFPRQQPKDFFP